jgi:hypothetical protein
MPIRVARHCFMNCRHRVPFFCNSYTDSDFTSVEQPLVRRKMHMPIQVCAPLRRELSPSRPILLQQLHGFRLYDFRGNKRLFGERCTCRFCVARHCVENCRHCVPFFFNSYTDSDFISVETSACAAKDARADSGLRAIASRTVTIASRCSARTARIQTSRLPLRSACAAKDAHVDSVLRAIASRTVAMASACSMAVLPFRRASPPLGAFHQENPIDIKVAGSGRSQRFGALRHYGQRKFEWTNTLYRHRSWDSPHMLCCILFIVAFLRTSIHGLVGHSRSKRVEEWSAVIGNELIIGASLNLSAQFLPAECLSQREEGAATLVTMPAKG